MNTIEKNNVRRPGASRFYTLLACALILIISDPVSAEQTEGIRQNEKETSTQLKNKQKCKNKNALKPKGPLHTGGGNVFGLSRHFDVFMEMNGRYMTKAKLAGITQENTGGHTIHLTPGFSIKFTPKMHLSLGVPIMAYRDLNGEQLSEDYRISTKLVYNF